MTIALVSLGAFSTANPAATTGSVTPAFGASTTSGNFLLARFGSAGPGTAGVPVWSTTSSGWTIAATGTEQFAYKSNCAAGETAPTFTFTSTNAVATTCADLSEWSGMGNSPTIDGSVRSDGSVSPPYVFSSLNATDSTVPQLTVMVTSFVNSKSGTVTWVDSWNLAGTNTANVGNIATKGTNFYYSTCFITAANTSQLSNSPTVTPSTGSLGGAVYSFISFVPHSVAVTVYPKPVRTLLQAANRASTI